MAWEDWVARQREAKAERTAGTLLVLAERYIELHGHVAPGRAGVASGPSVAGPRIPIRVDVVDTLTAVEAFTAETASLVWGSLRMGIHSPARDRSDVVHDLRRIADLIGRVFIDELDLGHQVARDAGKLAWRAGVALGVEQPATRLTVDCPECRLPALWWKQALGEVRCGNPDCSAMWDLLGESVLRYSTGTAN